METVTMLAIEAPKADAVIHWSIADILNRLSGDVDSYRRYSEACVYCDDFNFDGFGFMDECYSPHGEHSPRTPTLAEMWHHALNTKRNDDHYEDVVDSIQQHGFVRPLTSRYDGHELRLADGHHRLAAAIDLGMTTVPVKVYVGTGWTWPIAQDSGDWHKGYPIPTDIKGD